MSRANTAKSLFILNLSFKACHQRAGQLIELAEQAYACMDTNALEHAGRLLLELPAMERFSGAGEFYTALAGLCRGERARAGQLLQAVCDRSIPYRPKALLALGSTALSDGRMNEARAYYQEAATSNSTQPYMVASLVRNFAILDSLEGDHESALAKLESVAGLARIVGRKWPAHYLDYLNSRAVELNNLGRAEEARYYLQPCLSSPYLVRYSHWSETALEIHTATRSRVYIHSPLTDKISARVTSNTLRALMDDISRWRNKKPATEPAKPSLEDYLSSGHFKLYQAATQDDKLTEAQWDALYSIYTKFTEHLPEQAVLDNVLKAVDEELRGGQQQQ